MASVGAALLAGLHAGLAADAAALVDHEDRASVDERGSRDGLPVVELEVALVGGSRRGRRPARRVPRTTLYSGIFEIGSSARFVSWFAACDARPVVRDEHGVGSDRRHDRGRQGHLAAPRWRPCTRSPSATPSSPARRGCISQSGSGYWSHERADAPGLGSRQVLGDDPTGGEPHRVLVVDHLGRWPVGRSRGTGPCRRVDRTGRPRTGAACPGGRSRDTARRCPYSSSMRSQVIP